MKRAQTNLQRHDRMRAWLACLLALVIIQGLAVFSAMATKGPAEYRVPPEQVRVLPLFATHLTRRALPDESHYTQAQQFRAGRQVTKQFETVRHRRDIDVGNTAIWVPYSAHPVDFFLGGLPVSADTFPSRHRVGPSQNAALSVLDANDFAPGPNRFIVRMEAGSRSVGLGPIYIGPIDALEHAARDWARYIRLAGGAWILALVLWASAALVCFVSARPGATGRSLVAAGLLLPLGELLSWEFLTPLGGGLIIAGLAITVRPTIAIWRAPRTEDESIKTDAQPNETAVLENKTALPPIAIGAALCLLSAALLEAVLGLLPIWSVSREFLSLMNGAAIVIGGVVAGGVIAGQDLLALRRRARRAAQEILARDALIRQKDAALIEKAREVAIMEERQRFARDMHDGIGSQLTSLLLRLRSGRASPERIEQDISAGITDIRLVVDSLDHVGDDLAPALANFRARAQSQVMAAGIEFEWSQSGPLDRVQMDVRDVLSLYRFMQEALTNAVRHSGCRAIGINVDVTASRLSVLIYDDGLGFDPHAVKLGRGLRSLKERAERLGGALSLKSQSGGPTRILLDLAVDLSAAPLGQARSD